MQLKNLFKREKSAKADEQLNASLTRGSADDRDLLRPMLTPSMQSSAGISITPTQDDVMGAVARLYRYDDTQQFGALAEFALESVPHLYAVWQTRQGAVMRQTPKITETGDKEVDEACRGLLQSGVLREALPSLMLGVYYGCAAVEFLWGFSESKQRLYLREVVPVPPQNLVFDPVTREPALRPAKHGEQPMVLSERGIQFLVHTPRRSTSNPYTKGLAAKIIEHALTTPHALRSLVALLHRHGIPIAVGLTKDETGTDPGTVKKLRQQLYDGLKRLSGGSTMVVPHGTDVRFQDAPNTTGQLHTTTIDTLKADISQLVLGATLTSGTGNGTNTNALGEVHDGIRSEYALADAEALSRTLEKLLKSYVRATFGENVEVPSVYFSTETAKDVSVLMANVEKAHNMGIPFAAQEIRDRLDMRAPQPGEEATKPPSGEGFGLSAFGQSAAFSQHAPEQSGGGSKPAAAKQAELDDKELTQKIIELTLTAKSEEELEESLRTLVLEASDVAPSLTEQVTMNRPGF